MSKNKKIPKEKKNRTPKGNTRQGGTKKKREEELNAI